MSEAGGGGRRRARLKCIAGSRTPRGCGLDRAGQAVACCAAEFVMQQCTASHMPASPMSPLLLRMLPCPADRMQWLHALMQTGSCPSFDLCMPPC